MDPAKATGSSGTQGPRFAALYGALVTNVEDEVEPWLAESLEPNDDFTLWTLTLRDGLVFSDGTPFDAEAVRTNWERLADPASASPSFTVASTVASVEVVDGRTLHVTLSEPNAQFDGDVASTGLNYVASPESFASGEVTEPVGAGPFVLEEWVRDQQMVLARNPEYFDAPLPYLDRLTFQVVPDEQQRVDTYTTGAADMLYTLLPQSAEDAMAAADGSYLATDLPTATILLPNTAEAPFDDPRLREVLSLAIDRDALADIGYPGVDAATNFTLDDTPWYTSDAEVPDYDPEAAQALLDEIVADEGGPVEITMTASQPQASAAEFIQTSLNQLDGLEVELDAPDSTSFITGVRERDFMLALWGFPWVNPDTRAAPFLTTDSSGNYSGYANPDVDAAIAESIRTRSLDERAGLWQGIFTQVAEDLPVVPLLHGRFGWVVSPRLAGVELYEDGVPRWDLVHESSS